MFDMKMGEKGLVLCFDKVTESNATNKPDVELVFK